MFLVGPADQVRRSPILPLYLEDLTVAIDVTDVMAPDN